MTEPLRVYLDQNKFIELARTYYSHGHRRLEGLLALAFEVIRQGKAHFPFSAVHIMETQHSADKERAKRLVDFLLQLSRGVSIAPVDKVIPWEIRRAVGRFLHKPEPPGPSPVFGYGVAFAFGEEESIAKDLGISEEHSQLLLAISDSSLIMRKLLHDAVSKSEARYLKEQGQKVAQAVEASSDLESGYSKDVRLKARFARLHLLLQDEFMFALREHGLPFDFFFQGAFDAETLMSLMRSIPPLDVMVDLESERDENRGRRPQANDLGDIAALSVTIPYCDVVIVEKHCANVVKRRGLDKKYKTRVLTDLAALEPILRQTMYDPS